MSRDWADVLIELLDLISSNLLLPEDQLNYRLVCRSWHNVVPEYHHYPYLMLYQKSDQMWKFFQYNNMLYMDFPELESTEIRCSKYGWLLVSEHNDDDLFFFNPFSKQRIDLPCIEDKHKTISFFGPPTSSNCFIVGISSIVGFHMSISVLKRGDEEWKTFKYERARTPFVMSSCSPVLHRGLLYCSDMNGNIGTFDSNEDSWKVHNKCLSPARLHSRIREIYLIKLNANGEEVVHGVFVAHAKRQVKVYKLLEPEMKWELVEDLGNKVLFVSNSASFGGIAPLKSMANKIYFPKLHGTTGVFYSLNTNKYHSFDGAFSSNNSYGLKEMDFATWIMPISAPKFAKELTIWDEIN